MNLRNQILNLFLSCFLILSIGACKNTNVGSSNKVEQYRFGFYNVENLFDLEDTPNKIDEEFLPGSKKQWNQERYDKKLDHLSKVINCMQNPALLGVCEVENEAVCKDLAAHDDLKKFGYGVCHIESPDVRGIDVALLYQKELFTPNKTDYLRITFPKDVVPDQPDYTTRDILYVQGDFKNIPLHIFVNHWPSRRGGLKASSPKREYVASVLRKKLDEILAADPKANILIMGDFNDETDNKSVAEVLGASGEASDKLYNCSSKEDAAGKGTYNYKGNWNMLDQIIVSPSMLSNKKMTVSNTIIVREEWMMYQDKKYGATPSRTYGGPNYYGGYSDHLPVCVDVTVSKK